MKATGRVALNQKLRALTPNDAKEIERFRDFLKDVRRMSPTQVAEKFGEEYLGADAARKIAERR